MTKPYKLAISVGEPAGIGPDALLMLLNNPEFIANNQNILIAFCDPELLDQRAKLLKLKVNLVIIDYTDLHRLTLNNNNVNNSLYVVDTSYSSYNKNKLNFTPGNLDINNSKYVINSLALATRSCLDQVCDAIVTCPINKNIINTAGIPFTGHTEYIADACNQFFNYDHAKPQYQPIMLLMGRDYYNLNLKVALMTTHLPLNQIPAHITQELIIAKIILIHQELINKFNIKQPRILVTGLNPHAGENGSLGTEEIDTMIPALNILKKTYGLDITGPLAADSIFTNENIKNFDIIVAMYHDQGLTGFKARCFNHAANVTLGLPIIRTSVDHGTALSLAGTGNINTDSLKFAIDTANLLIKNKLSHDRELRTSAT